MIRFHDSTLFISARSPFARRVRLALIEHGVSYREEVVDVFKPTAHLIAVNPWARVPALRLADGAVLIESEKILGVFYALSGEGISSPLRPRDDAEALTVAHWSALAVAFSEKTVEYYLETLRPAGARDAEITAEFETGAQRMLDELERFLVDRSLVIPGHLTQADLDLGSALAYYSLRYSPAWRARYPGVAAYLAGLEIRPSFRATQPPPAP